MLRRLLGAAVLAASVSVVTAQAADPQSISDAEFVQLHRMIKPQRGEARWMEIDWYPSVWEARQQAAAAGKPLLLMAGSGGAPAAGC